MTDKLPESSYAKMIDAATRVYQETVKGEKQVPRKVLSAARCIAVIPDVLTGALVIGGTHGNGLASCKTSRGTWSEPVAISLTEGSIGVQAGAKSTDLVLFFQNDRAERALKQGKLLLGADASAAAGEYDAAYDWSSAGIVAYSRTDGVFAGASIGGSQIGKDSDRMATYFGKSADYLGTLEGRLTPDSSNYAVKLTKLFPNA